MRSAPALSLCAGLAFVLGLGASLEMPVAHARTGGGGGGACSPGVAVTAPSVTVTGNTDSATYSGGAFTSSAIAGTTSWAQLPDARMAFDTAVGTNNYFTSASAAAGLGYFGTNFRIENGNLITTGVGAYANWYGTFSHRNSLTGYPIKVDDVEGLMLTPQAGASLKTCGATQSATVVEPGTITPIARAGAVGQKLCLCELRGDGAYYWRNLIKPTDTAGTTTACPASE